MICPSCFGTLLVSQTRIYCDDCHSTMQVKGYHPKEDKQVIKAHFNYEYYSLEYYALKQLLRDIMATSRYLLFDEFQAFEILHEIYNKV